jgi:predicted AAA+ superfamily ATPase
MKNVIRKQYMEKVMPFIDKNIIKVITGVRRCGKSEFLKYLTKFFVDKGIKKENIFYFNFEKKECEKYLDGSSLHDYIIGKARKKTKNYVFLDEIQEVKDWERIVNSLHTNKHLDIYITGSNSKLLSGELATYLTGRTINIEMYPFSFSEFVTQFNGKEPKGALLKKYIQFGGFPFLSSLNYDANNSKIYLQDLTDAIVIKDIVQRYDIREIEKLDRVIKYLLLENGKLTTASNISKYFKNENRTISTDTVLNYISASVNSYLFRKCSRYDIKGKKNLAVNEKYYSIDHGLRNNYAGNHLDDIGLILENIVCIELLRRGFEVKVGVVGNKEVDFVARKNNEVAYIQVCYMLADEKVIDREFSVFDGIKDNYEKIVLSLDEFDFSRNGIRHHNLESWLLA